MAAPKKAEATRPVGLVAFPFVLEPCCDEIREDDEDLRIHGKLELQANSFLLEGLQASSCG